MQKVVTSSQARLEERWGGDYLWLLTIMVVMTLNRIGATVAKSNFCYQVPKGWIESLNSRVSSLKEQNVLFFFKLFSILVMVNPNCFGKAFMSFARRYLFS